MSDLSAARGDSEPVPVQPNVVAGRSGPSGLTAVFEPGWAGRLTRAAASALAAPDLTDSELELAQLGALIGSAFVHAPIGMAIVAADGQIVIANDALARIVGHSSEQLAKRTFGSLMEPEDRLLDDTERDRLIAGEVACYEASIRLRRTDGTPVWVSLTASRDGAADPGMLIYQLQDISERRELEGRLTYMIDHDLLTGLFNRRRFDQELTRQVRRNRRFEKRGAVLVMDIDGFKGVNDQFGHAAGDELLRSLGVSLRARSRETDLPARLSGDEFAVLLPDASREEAETVAAELIELVRRDVRLQGGEPAHVTASVGVAMIGGHSEAEVLALADTAMYAAKEQGRDRFVVFEPGDPMPPAARQAGEANRLRRALAEQRFVLHAQPVWDLANQRVETYELLIRMRDKTGDALIAPNAFLYAAERFGLIAAIDSWVLAQAVDLIAAHARHGRRIVLSVNLSGRSIGDAALDAHIDRALYDSGIDPSCLIFELTETAAIGNIEAAIAFSHRLHERGCRFALDDFGAGFASFYYLKKLPFDYLKIDGDFIRGLPRSPVDQLVIGAIVTIARGMGKQTVAEFVTDQETSDLLRASGVDYAQGFHIGRPAPIEDILATT